MKKIKVSIDEIIKLSNYSHRDFGTFASFLKGLADSDGFIEVDSNNELLETHTVKEAPLKNWKGCPDCLCEEGMDHDIECERLKKEPTTPENDRKDWILHDGIYFPPNNECFAHRIPNHDIKNCWEMVYKKPEKNPHTKPMKKCKICKMDYCPECFEFCPMCPRPSVSECQQGESEKRNDVY